MPEKQIVVIGLPGDTLLTRCSTCLYEKRRSLQILSVQVLQLQTSFFWQTEEITKAF